MKKLVLGLTMAITLATAAAPSYATFGSYHKHTGFNKIHVLFPFMCDHKVKPTKPEPAKPTKPEPAKPTKPTKPEVVKPTKPTKPTKPEIVKPTKPTKPTPTPTTPVKSVPEIDAAGAGLALAFVGGILAIRRERRKLQK